MADLTYVAGPMSSIGPPTWNYPAFHEMAARLRSAGFDVVNPAELQEPDPNQPWDFYLRRDLAELVKCNRMVFLQGWERSSGATLEHTVAKALGFELVYPHEFDSWFAKAVAA